MYIWIKKKTHWRTHARSLLLRCCIDVSDASIYIHTQCVISFFLSLDFLADDDVYTHLSHSRDFFLSSNKEAGILAPGQVLDTRDEKFAQISSVRVLSIT